jgi:hypothetical protein
VDYWIAITSEKIKEKPGYHFYSPDIEKNQSGKRLWIITSRGWERDRSPPSLFEYLLWTVFRCVLQSLSSELSEGDLKKRRGLGTYQDKNGETKDDDMETKGCLFDFTHRRISVSNHSFCTNCDVKLALLQNSISDKVEHLHLTRDVNFILEGNWLGSTEEKGTPIYNLKRIYKYDVERNSGFNKRLWEKFRDSIFDKGAEWTVGTILVAIISGIMAFLMPKLIEFLFH